MMPDSPGPLTVALPISSFLPAQGGAEIGLHNIALQLLRKGHRPVVITSIAHTSALRRRGWTLPYEVVAYPPRVLTWRETRAPLARLLLNRFHQFLQWRYRFDVWHATFGFPTGVSVIEFCRGRRIAHLVRCVGADIQVRRDIGYGMRLNPDVDRSVRTWLPKAQCLVAITESVVEEYKKIGVAEDSLVRIPNGIDLARFKAHRPKGHLRRKLGIAKEAVIFLALGRNHRKKNFAQLIDAAVDLRNRNTDLFSVVIAGRGVGDLAGNVDSAGAKGLVHLVEPDDDFDPGNSPQFPANSIMDLYFEADVFVMPSLIETFGIVLIEAMAAGLPVIAADSPGCRDVIRGGKDGIMYGGDTAALVEAMQTLLEVNQRETWVQVALARSRQFDWDQIVGRYVSIYRSCMKADKGCFEPKQNRAGF